MECLSTLTSKELAVLVKQKREEERQKKLDARRVYEGLRNDALKDIEPLIRDGIAAAEKLYLFCIGDLLAFRSVMSDYGELRRDNQLNFHIQNDQIKVEVKSSKQKCFDERADIAAAKLIDFLRQWIKSSKNGEEDAMYQLAMTLLERNRQGDLDYKSISKLYKLEEQFGSPEYSNIMSLFKESDTVEKTSINFYFFERSELGVWRKLEPSFNMM